MNAFKELTGIVVVLVAIGVGLVVAAIMKGERALGGMAIYVLGLAWLVSIPAWFAYQKRHSDEPWGVNGP